KSLRVAEAIKQKHGMRSVTGASGIAKVTVSGIGLRSHTQVGTVLFERLAADHINVQMISTSELQVTAVIDSSKAQQATDNLKEAFAGLN
ncbi:MAG: ACT domain-containing protein, partial [Planctomycetota bacterium]